MLGILFLFLAKYLTLRSPYNLTCEQFCSKWKFTEVEHFSHPLSRWSTRIRNELYFAQVDGAKKKQLQFQKVRNLDWQYWMKVHRSSFYVMVADPVDDCRSKFTTCLIHWWNFCPFKTIIKHFQFLWWKKAVHHHLKTWIFLLCSLSCP